METRKQMILDALDAFVRQRPGLEFGNYGNRATYFAERRSITKTLHDYRALRRTVELRDSITADNLIQAFSAYSGRLTISEHVPAFISSTRHTFKLDYCTGQYFPTEYRKAACAVMASALWERKREDMPAVVGYCVESWAQVGKGRVRGPIWKMRETADADLTLVGGRQYGAVTELYPGNMSAGNWIRASFRKEFGRGIASRWFS